MGRKEGMRKGSCIWVMEKRWEKEKIGKGCCMRDGNLIEIERGKGEQKELGNESRTREKTHG